MKVYSIAQSFDVDPKEAIEIQKKLKEQVSLVSLKKPIKTIAGADVSLNMFGKDLYAGIVVFSYPDLKLIEKSFVKMEASFPYIPGLLSFREIPALLSCWQKLKKKPDLVMVDGQGIAHPRHLGIATHFGILVNTPTIGVAKSRLYGIYKEPIEVGSYSDIMDPKDKSKLGVALKSKKNSSPLIISPGNLITVKESLEITRNCLKGYRIPEPTREAHIEVNNFRKSDKI